MKKPSQNFGLIVATLLFPLASFADEVANAAAANHAWIAFPIGLGVAIAAGLAALGQGKIAAAYMAGASRNPGAVNVMKTQFILGLVFVETLVLFTLLIELMLLGKM